MIFPKKQIIFFVRKVKNFIIWMLQEMKRKVGKSSYFFGEKSYRKDLA